MSHWQLARRDIRNIAKTSNSEKGQKSMNLPPSKTATIYRAVRMTKPAMRPIATPIVIG
jgi:hypothetical protein